MNTFGLFIWDRRSPLVDFLGILTSILKILADF
jgi:hypothetical protein